MDIAREVISFPNVACLAFKTQKGLIRRTPSLLGVEPHFGSLLLAIDGQDFGVEIENHRREHMGFAQEMTTESVVQVLESC